ncbi:MAG: hypothetical protein WCO60_10790 [Verrucomicrobiota bacterium]
MSPQALLFLSVVLAIAGFWGGRTLSIGSALVPKVSTSDASPARGAYSTADLTLPRNEFPEIKHTETISEEVASVAEKRMLSRWMRTTSLVRATPEELETLIRNKNGVRSEQEQWFAFKRLAELDPKRAADLWAQNHDPDSGVEIRNSQSLARWAEKDPDAFAAWTLSQIPEVQQRSRYALDQLGFNSPARFAAIAPALSETPAARSAAANAIQGMKERDKNSGENAISYALSLPAGPCRDAALVAMLRWPEARPEERPEVVAALSRMDLEEAHRLGDQLGKIAGVLPPGAARESAFIAALRNEAGKDVAAATKRLEALSGTPDYAAAVRGLVEKIASNDPSAAADWALTIPNSSTQQRSSALEIVASTWFKAAPDAARAWVDNAALSDTEYFRLTGRNRNR